MLTSSLLVASLLTVLPTPAPLEDTLQLKPGDSAPPLAVDKWIKGTPAPSFEQGKPYVIEFWATWCSPCVASMPHLSRMQTEHRDDGLTIIGVTRGDSSNTLESVEKMVEEKGAGMGYTVAWDEKGAVYASYMDAAGQTGIPCSFLIDGEGKIAYIGHPATLEWPLSKVIAGTWNPERDLAVIAKADRDVEIFKQTLITEPDKALIQMDAFVVEFPQFATRALDVKYQLLLALQRFEDAYGVCALLIDGAIEDGDAQALNGYAWGLVDPAQTWITIRDIPLAKRAALKAVEFSKGVDGAILDTLARVFFAEGNLHKALELQRMACKLDPEHPDLQKALKEYEAAKPAK